MTPTATTLPGLFFLSHPLGKQLNYLKGLTHFFSNNHNNCWDNVYNYIT